MKRIPALLLALLLTLPSLGLAGGVIPNLRDTPTAEPSSAAVFTFRGGVQWNMTRELVKALEPLELMEQSRDSWSILIPLTKVEVSKFTADLVYMFYSDRLKMISYDFGVGGSEADFQYLTGALDSVYGDHTEPAASEIKGIMDQIYPGYYDEQHLLNRKGWKAGEDTLIYLYYYADGAYAILYVSAAGAAPSYVTTGL